MLSKRSFSPHKSSPSEEEIESPFGKQGIYEKNFFIYLKLPSKNK